MGKSRSLPVIIPHIPNQRWACHSCGACCRTLVGFLTLEEKRRIDEQGWKAELGVAPYLQVGQSIVLNKREDGACVFLTEDNRCRIHSRFGEAAKPLACRIFPFSVRPVSQGWQASFRFDCPSATGSRGEPLSHYRNALTEMVAQMPHPGEAIDEAKLSPGRDGSPEVIKALTGRLTSWLRGESGALIHRVIGAARATTILGGIETAGMQVRDFQGLLDALFKAVAAESAASSEPAAARQRGFLRQLVFAHSEHLTLKELSATGLRRFGTRWRQLRHARQLRRGRGFVPALPSFSRTIPFAEVEAIEPVVERVHEIEDLLIRYLLARLESRSAFGEGYYGWPVCTGLGALWLSVAVIGWLSRYAAAHAGRSRIEWDDVATAVGIVDRAATRLPALGTFAERARVNYLSRDDGIARLLLAYPLCEVQA